jgi:hypothetical protein
MLKTKTERALAFVVVFLAGCEAQRLAAVPTAYASEPGQRWEYACMDTSGGLSKWSAEDLATQANKFGREGWELVGAGSQNSDNWCFKRPLGVAAAAPRPVSAQ